VSQSSNNSECPLYTESRQSGESNDRQLSAKSGHIQTEFEAKAFRKQHGGGEQFGGAPLKVEVVKMAPLQSGRAGPK